ncbi:unnamed protein product, partial [Vitis vinifera]|uniref:Uncharacterized protein n=1 Tax=Vitis vinifera TaxID=29760 RepID=D7U629_VITVI
MVSIISPSYSFSSLRKTLKKLMNNIIITKIGLEASHGSLVRVFSNNGVSFHVSSTYSIVYKNWNIFLDKIIWRSERLLLETSSSMVPYSMPLILRVQTILRAKGLDNVLKTINSSSIVF